MGDDVMPLETQVEILATVLREELTNLWGDLVAARRAASPADGWSIAAEGIRDRIITVSHVVGPVDPMDVDMPLLLDGTFDAVHDFGGITSPAWDRDEVQATWDAYLAAQPATLRVVRD